MGTNYYLKKNLNSEDKLRLIKDIINDEENAEDIQELLKSKYVHIGKQSWGWKFLFDANNFKYFSPDLQSIEEFLSSGIIEDEYGKEYTKEEFLNKIAKEGFTLESYFEELQSLGVNVRDKCIEFELEYGIRPNDFGEFDIGNLHFTIQTDFS